MEETSIRFSLLRGQDNSRLTKSYRLNDRGGICKTNTPNFANGTAETTCIEKLSEIEGVGSIEEIAERLYTAIDAVQSHA